MAKVCLLPRCLFATDVIAFASDSSTIVVVVDVVVACKRPQRLPKTYPLITCT